VGETYWDLEGVGVRVINRYIEADDYARRVKK